MILNIQDDILKLHSLGLLDKLLLDKTTGKRVMWATDAYTALGPRYERNEQIKPELITGPNASVIKTRARKELEQQSSRTRQHGEVSTPLWVCRKMCGYLDEIWDRKARWQKYVDARVLEITCGEAPFLVSRYDVETGEAIPVPDRIGLLDRKLRAVNENVRTEEEWLKWAFRAFWATYGYEFQGDNLLIARVNLLMTFQEYLLDRWKRKPTIAEYNKFVNVIVWNVWQMNGLKGVIPYGTVEEEFQEIDWFGMLGGDTERNAQPRCLVHNWTGGGSVEFLALPTRGKRAMKFDFVIGNPPYQEERKGESTTALPIYHNFMSGAYAIGNVVELITPARFLFNAGRTPKKWNEEMLSDEHLKVLYYEKEANTIFPNTEIKGGVAITYRDANSTFFPIGTFTIYQELNAILHKVMPFLSGGSMSALAFVASKFNTKALFKDYAEFVGHERRMSSNVLSFSCFHGGAEHEEDILIYGIYNKKRAGRYISPKYVDLSDTNIQKYKIIMPKADGNGTFGDTLTTPEILPPKSGFTHTFLGMGGFASEDEASAALKYIKSKFARALLGVLKVTQDINADKWRYVPLQDFTSASDIDWGKSISEIDQQLYKKYGLDETEIQFIESHVKEMT